MAKPKKKAKIGGPNDVYHYFKDEHGQWWFRYPKQRTRCEVRVCIVCGDEFPARKVAKNRCCSCQCGNRVREKIERVHETKRQRYPSKSGSKYKDQEGYVRLYLPEYTGTPTGSISEHRYVMEQHLGRRLYPGETVHHKNGIRNDNRIENLELWATRHHSGQRVTDLVTWAAELLARYVEPGQSVTSGDKQITVQLAA